MLRARDCIQETKPFEDRQKRKCRHLMSSLTLLSAPTMDDEEKDKIEKEREDPAHEAAAAELWAVCISETEKYDRGLVESWKSDMKGMVLFAGLFSANLTPFLIESYKTLIPDSGDESVLLLAQISQQLAASANETVFAVTPAPSFARLTSSHVLWFIGLGLSLTCALIALLEQWARDLLYTVCSPRLRVYSLELQLES